MSNTAPTWLTATPATGAGNSTVNLSASPNLSGVPRAGIITIAGQTVQVTQTSGLLAFHSAPGYLPGSTVTVSCTLVATGAPNSVAWHATLPSGWTYLSGTGEGTQKPTAGSSGVLDWSWNPVPPNPVAFTCTLQVPAGQSGPKTLAAAVAYRWNGVANPVTNNALPDPLVIPEILYHTADYRTPFWQMDGTEVNRVLSYWRAGGYHRDPVGVDGFAPGPGATNGARHAADFREASWMIDGTEVNRVLSYWRAGGYHRDTNGVDGYAPGAP